MDENRDSLSSDIKHRILALVAEFDNKGLIDLLSQVDDVETKVDAITGLGRIGDYYEKIFLEELLVVDDENIKEAASNAIMRIQEAISENYDVSCAHCGWTTLDYNTVSRRELEHAAAGKASSYINDIEVDGLIERCPLCSRYTRVIIPNSSDPTSFLERKYPSLEDKMPIYIPNTVSIVYPYGCPQCAPKKPITITGLYGALAGVDFQCPNCSTNYTLSLGFNINKNYELDDLIESIMWIRTHYDGSQNFWYIKNCDKCGGERCYYEYEDSSDCMKCLEERSKEEKQREHPQRLPWWRRIWQ